MNVEILLAFLDGSKFANTLRRNGKPGRIQLPVGPALPALVAAHLHGLPAELEFSADGHRCWRERVDAVVLGGYCPGADGNCRWIGIDLDATDHGACGLADPVHAMRVLAERADALGLGEGVLTARSRRGKGRHVFLLLPEPIPLEESVLGLAQWVAAAFRVSQLDVIDYAAYHAFRCANRNIAEPGAAGAVELFPHSTLRPHYGWAMTLPSAGAFARFGGGVIIDSFTDEQTALARVPKCSHQAWQALVGISPLRTLGEFWNESMTRHSRFKEQWRPSKQIRNPIKRIDPRTRAFLDGHAEKGSRNKSAFAATMNLLGCGMSYQEAESRVLAAAAACGLSATEARQVIRSAHKTFQRVRKP